MKKIFIAVLLVIVATGTAMAQPGSRDGRGGREMREAMREKMKTELQLSDAQADSVQAVQHEFQMKLRDLRQNHYLNEEQRKAAAKELNEKRKAKIKTILSDEQAQKLEEMMEKQRSMRQERQGMRNGNNK